LTITIIFDKSYITYILYLTQNHDKMKTKTNIALEGTCNGDVAGGLYREPRENLQALLFSMEGGDSMPDIDVSVSKKEITGIVTAEKCKYCGHHEIGITTEDGRYIKLEIGTEVTIHVTHD